MDDKNKKKIIYILNYDKNRNLDYLEKNFNVELTYINSVDLIGLNINQLIDIIENYNIFIIGGGMQHLYNDYDKKYPEILNQIELVKLINKTNKLLIGICLGCQIIGLAFGYKITSMDKYCFGFNYLDIKSINYEYIIKSNDKYLCNFNWDLIKKSLSSHLDYIDFNLNNYNYDNNLICICVSKINKPYIVVNSTSNIYGFQFHPEFMAKYLDDSQISILTNDDLDSYKYFANNDILIYLHFFSVFLNN